jgi:glyoxylase-like metal-dependent hydrolase (beta-lactamase superfamily II)
MTIKTLVVGPLEVNCYIIHNDKDAICIDPGDDPDMIMDYLTANSLSLGKILLTHAHFDHIGGVKSLYDKYKPDIYLHKGDYNLYTNASGLMPGFTDHIKIEVPKDVNFIEDNDIVSFSDKDFKVIHTPGHSRGSVCYYYDDVLFTGDTIFRGSIGRTDLPGGDYNTIISSIKNKLCILSDNTVIYPGHMGISTIKEEKLSNPFL